MKFYYWKSGENFSREVNGFIASNHISKPNNVIKLELLKKFENRPLSFHVLVSKINHECIQLLSEGKNMKEISVENSIINICLQSSGLFAPHAAALIASIMENKADSEDIVFWYLCDKVSENIKNKIASMRKKWSFTIHFIDVSDDSFREFPIHNGSYATYYKLALGRLLPHEVSKIIYLDSDMIVTTSLASLYHTDIWECYAAVVAESLKRHFPLGGPYFNAGMVLFNLEKWRCENLEGQAIQFGYDHPDWIIWVDQDILNYLFKGNVIYLPLKWNKIPSEILLGNSTQWGGFYSETEMSKVGKELGIIHYAWIDKPWLPMCQHPNKASYWKYARKTPFYKQVLREYRRAIPKRFFLGFANSLKTMRQRLFQLRTGHNGYLRIFGKTIFDCSKEIETPVVPPHKRTRFHYNRYRLLSNITFGTLRKKYNAKRKVVKESLQSRQD